ncbi:MAG: serine/threonine dehydratase [Hyphomicrobiaceae bacterium]|nr:serine/threonine dehydratase [Hyphomicrobiaceae bacterium]
MAGVGRVDIEAAVRRIGGRVRETPVLSMLHGLDGIKQALQFKLEYLQVAGSFKARGAFNSLLSGCIPAAGVAAASGGNHGVAVAVAARAVGVRATIFVPEISAAAKVAAIRDAGAELRIGGATYNDALMACEAFLTESGALSVHAYDTVETVAGQGTLAWEWDGQMPFALDTVLVAVGGGGLIGGLATWWGGRGVKVVGVEPVGSRALHAALEAGRPVDVSVKSVAADSLGAKRAGALAFEIARRSVADVVLVEDAAIEEAQQSLWRSLRVAMEPGGAAAWAALLSGAYRPEKHEKIGVLLCGANVDLGRLADTVKGAGIGR